MLITETAVHAQTHLAEAKNSVDSISTYPIDSLPKKRSFFGKILNYFNDANKEKKNKKFDFSIIGGPHYSSDTKFGIGLVAAGLYRTDRNDSILPPSNVSLYGDVSTVGFYLLGVRGNHLFPQDKYRLNYNLYFYSFPSLYWGQGYDNGANDDNESEYDRFQAQVKVDFMFRMARNFYIGPMTAFDYVYGHDFEKPELWKGMKARSTNVSLGFSLLYDSRDFLTNAYKGYYLRIDQRFSPAFLGNKYAFSNTELTTSYYQSVWKGGVLAGQFHTLLNYGNPPWGLMATLGSSYSMRGYYEGRYRDKCAMDAQLELRQHVWKRNGVAVWVGAGTIFPNFSELEARHILPNYGFGYRWEFKKRVNTRPDLYSISMKLFRDIKKWFDNQEHLFYLFLVILIVPNVVLCFTEPISWTAKICNILLPLSIYYAVMAWSRNCGRTFWLLFPFIFFGAFQLVLLYLFGQSIIAVDMFLNLVTTNSSEALELLDNLIPAIVIVVVLYIPALILATISIVHKRRLSEAFIRQARRRTLYVLSAGILSLGTAYLTDNRYEPKSELYPANVCYNIALAFQRTAQTRNYHKTSKDFTFHARSTHQADEREVYVMVVGETSRACNWALYGYERETNPGLSGIGGLTAFSHVLTESNTTHKSVPMLLSPVSASSFDSIYYQKGIITAFKEAGYQTAFFSNQRYNHSFIDFFGKEADTYDFIKEDVGDSNYNPSDNELLKLVAKELGKGVSRQFIVLHTYGSHFNYKERYPAEQAFFLPDMPVDAEVKYKDNLINAYDNSIRYTDNFLVRLIDMLREQHVNSALIYTSDHGEDIFDDNRHLFLHASPVPSYYQIHVPFFIWMSDNYRQRYPSLLEAAQANRQKNVSSSASFFQTMLEIGGVETPYRNDSLSVTSALFIERPRVYLNDHNEARTLDDVGMLKEDFKMLEEKGIR